MRPAAPRLRVLASGVLAAASLGACVVLPIPRPRGTLEGMRGNVSDTMPAFFVEGRTTRAELLLTLGEPDRRADGDRWFAYDSGRRLAGVNWVALVGGAPVSSPGFVLGVRETVDWRELRLRFDEAGVLVQAELVTRRQEGFRLGDAPSAPEPERPARPGLAQVALQEARLSFVAVDPGDRLREAFVAGACRTDGAWRDAVVYVSDLAVSCRVPGQPPWRIEAADIAAADWWPAEDAPNMPAVRLRRRDGTTADFAFHPLDAADAASARRRAALFLDSVRLLADGFVAR